ncbi:MAG TPA: hypothetical protein VFL60_06785 [Gaiellaceae bacterium]|nr:hypothetical protein [Gaiellaceae bacterium]
MIVAPPAPPPVALAVSPTRLVLAAGETRTIEVTNRGTGAATVDALPTGLAFGLRGRPRILLRTAAAVAVRPRRLVVPRGETATLAVSSPRRLQPGDRPALVLVSTRGRARGVGVGLRVGVVVLVRGGGRVVRRLVPLALHVRGRRLELLLRNAGNVSEQLAPATVHVRLLRRGRVVARPWVEQRELLPHTRGIVRLRLARRLRGDAVAVVRVLATTRRFRVKPAGRR